jgi:hypothetical protein
MTASNCFDVPSLSYHYKNCVGKRAFAFEYAIKSIDQAVSFGAFSSGLALALEARELAITRTEISILLAVVSSALDDLMTKAVPKISFGQYLRNLLLCGSTSATAAIGKNFISVQYYYYHLLFCYSSA